MIHLTYSPRAFSTSRNNHGENLDYLRYLENQREDLKKAVLEAPRYRLDNLATFVETHSDRLNHCLEALAAYRRNLRKTTLKNSFIGLLLSLMGAGAGVALLAGNGILGDPALLLFAGSGAAAALMLLWLAVMMRILRDRFHRRALKTVDALTSKDNQHRRDTWAAVRETVLQYLGKTSGRFSLGVVKRDWETVQAVSERGAREVREALNELAALRPDMPITEPPGPFLASLMAEKDKET